jgi:hypothetical protein
MLLSLGGVSKALASRGQSLFKCIFIEEEAYAFQENGNGAVFRVAGQCGAPAAPEPVVQTVVVKETVVIEKEGEKVVQTVEVVKEVMVTPTPEPEAAGPQVAAVAPDFKNEDTYVVITGAGEPQTLDPAWTYETAASSIEANIYEGLVWFNRERTDDYIPALATDWTRATCGFSTSGMASSSTRGARWNPTTWPTPPGAPCCRGALTARTG